MTGSSPSEDNDVIGKTKIVYLEHGSLHLKQFL